MMQNPSRPHLQSPYRSTPSPSLASASSGAAGANPSNSSNGAFNVRALEQSLDDSHQYSQQQQHQQQYMNAHASGSGSTAPLPSSSSSASANLNGYGRDSPSKSRQQEQQQHYPPHTQQQYSHSQQQQQHNIQQEFGTPPPLNSHTSSNGSITPSARSSGGATATPGPGPSSSSSHNNTTPGPPAQTTLANGGTLSATRSQSTNSRSASRNPLIDLIETEKGYVDDLGLVIKKVAAAWSRSNFPPPALDKMFRAIESVYRIDKSFLAKLNEIGPNPSSPKALGDLLMRWIDDLEPAYTKYVNAYQTDFDNYAPVQSNPNLLPILQSLPPLFSSPSSSFDNGNSQQDLSSHPTLDELFALPLERMKYYKKLYGKLLKSTQPGKSDHTLLVGANEKLDWLLDMSRSSGERRVTMESSPSSSSSGDAGDASAGGEGGSTPQGATASTSMPANDSAARSSEEQVRTRARQHSTSQTQLPNQLQQSQGLSAAQQQQQSQSTEYSQAPLSATPTRQPSHLQHHPHLSSAHSSTSSNASIPRLNTNLNNMLPPSDLSSRPPSSNDGNISISAVSSSSVERSSGQTTASTVSTAPTNDSMSLLSGQSLLELERRLDTSRTLDIFTMKPKKCKLQMHPPNLPYQRSIRQAGDVQISFVPASSPSQSEVFTSSAVIYLLTDLFLLCERIPPSSSSNTDMMNRTNPNADFWLMYPPLATKHLKAYRSAENTSLSETSFEIEIMRKERMTVFAESREKRDEWLESFQEAINFGGGAASALRVNTDVSRSISPFSAASLSGGKNTPLSNGASPLPPLPPSASTTHFSSPHSSRAPTPQDPPPPPAPASQPQAVPMQQQRSLPPQPAHSQQHHPYQTQSPERHPPYPMAGPLSAPPRSQSNVPFPPGPGPPMPMQMHPRMQGQMLHSHSQSQSPPMRSLPSPMQQSFSQPSLSRPLPNNGHNGPLQGQYRNHPQHDSYPLPNGQQHQMQYGSYNENQPPGAYGNAPLPPPHSVSLRKAPSMRSVGSLSSRSTTSGPASSNAPSPIPPLPMKEHYAQQNDWQAAQAANRRMENGMQQGPGAGYGMHQPDMRNGGLLSPSRSQNAGQAQAHGPIHRSKSAEGLRAEHYRMPSAVLKDTLRGQSMPTQSGARSLPTSRMNSGYVNDDDGDISPPMSPVLEGPITNQLAAQMKCKVFVQSAKNQWKSLGTAKLKLYLQSPGNRKQLVVEDKTVLISTIVLEDGVERVGKTGVAIELSDNGQRTGLIYMLQMKTEASATGLFQQLLLGSSRASAMVLK